MADVIAEIFRCNVCGNVVEILRGGAGTLVCCGQNMERMGEKTADMGREKHAPVIQVVDGKVSVKVGSVPHPMEEKHFIEWIEVTTEKGCQRKWLSSGTRPEAVFCLQSDLTGARAFCNIHGLWKSS